MNWGYVKGEALAVPNDEEWSRLNISYSTRLLSALERKYDWVLKEVSTEKDRKET